MRILYVGLHYEYGMQDRGINEIGEKGFHQTFIKLGHTVDFFYYDEFLNSVDLLQTKILEKAQSFQPDLIFFQMLGDQFKKETLLRLKESFKTMNWFGDDQWRFESFTKKYAPWFTYCVTTDPFALAKYRRIGVENVFLSQWAALDYFAEEPSDNSEYKYDVSFVGGSHSVRRWFIKELRKRKIEVQAFGFGWPSGPIPLRQMMDVFKSSKINLNLSNSTNYDLRYLVDNFKNPVIVVTSDKSVSQIKARNFEIPSCGGFQMTDYVPFIEKYLTVGQEVVCYRDVDEAASLINYYLDNENERESIRRAGQIRSLKEHSYLSRLQRILNSL